MTGFGLQHLHATLRRIEVWHGLLFAYYCVAIAPCVLDLVDRSANVMHHCRFADGEQSIAVNLGRR